MLEVEVTVQQMVLQVVGRMLHQCRLVVMAVPLVEGTVGRPKQVNCWKSCVSNCTVIV